MILFDRSHLGLLDIDGRAERLRAPGGELRGGRRARRRRGAAQGRLHPRPADRGRRSRRRGRSAGSTASRCWCARGASSQPRSTRSSPTTRASTSASSSWSGRRRMSGHSKWSSIKHKKGAADAKRGQLFSKLTRAIIVAAREGGPGSRRERDPRHGHPEGARQLHAQGQHRARRSPAARARRRRASPTRRSRTRATETAASRSSSKR